MQAKSHIKTSINKNNKNMGEDFSAFISHSHSEKQAKSQYQE